ncbi:hypothetical protein L7F22_068083 [Adiantum nelumboides]|nr:hypothetical protein [Adiantum nelumboides]
MSQLVSARLLIGPGASRGAALTCLSSRKLTRSLGSSNLFSTSSVNKRSLNSNFFLPSYDAHQVNIVPIRPAPVSNRLYASIRSLTSTRRNQQHLAISAYAPPSDDPEITSRIRPKDGTLSELNPSLTPSQALAAGYRPVPVLTSKTLPRLYRQLAKAQLTFLVTLTGMAGYALCPAVLSTSTSITTLLSMTFGTALCSASANALNQMVESPYDAQMPRTRNRPLPSRSITPLHAASFATVAGIGGVGALATINPLTAALGLANIVLYSGIYTPMKRVSIVNTWVGSIVGGIPPLIGWTACTGTLHLATDLPGWALAALLFAWQFPHFNSLAHTLRREYARGGYRMMSVTDPSLNRRTSLRYAISLLPICSILLPWTGVVHWSYAILSAPINLALVYASYGFWKHDGDKAARQCFWVSLIHLPAILLLAMACKTEVIEGVQRRILGEKDEEVNE